MVTPSATFRSVDTFFMRYRPLELDEIYVIMIGENVSFNITNSIVRRHETKVKIQGIVDYWEEENSLGENRE